MTIEVIPIKHARVSKGRVPLVVRRGEPGTFRSTADLMTPCAWEVIRGLEDGGVS